MAERALRVAVLVYGALNAALYANLLPLWDGFDEPFHYGYVNHLSRTHSFPVLGETHISDEIAGSFAFTPASHLVRRNVPAIPTFEEYFRLSQERRAAMRGQLERSVHPEMWAPGGTNYESQQAPLAYALLAPFDWRWRESPLPERVVWLRLLGGLISTLGTGIAVMALSRRLGAAGVVQALTAFLVFSSQLFYATVARVSNDWLAVPLFLWLVLAAMALYRKPGWAPMALFALVLAAGLLTKAYFLALAPFAAGVLLVLFYQRRVRAADCLGFAALVAVCAGPWYARNLRRYHNVTGMQEMSHGITGAAFLRALRAVPWLRSLWTTLHRTAWTGNNSATSFSARTVNVMLALTLVVLLLYLARAIRQGMPAPDRMVQGALACFAGGLIYYTTLTYWSTTGASIGPEPWYVEVCVPALGCLLLYGLPQWGFAGRMLGVAFTWLWSYVLWATYLVKLIPFYGGYTAMHAQPSELVHWYRAEFASGWGVLETTVAGPWRLVLVLCGAVIVVSVMLAVWLTVALARMKGSHASLDEKSADRAMT